MTGSIGPYRIVRQLGAGGMGAVYLAYDERLDRHVAIKRMLPSSTRSQKLRARFRCEARIAAKLNHPAIVHIYDIIEEGDFDCLVMEYIEGASLRQRLSRGRIALVHAVELGRQIADGMAEAHDAGIIHRDLKTENILLTHSGKAKIVDFGIAKLAGVEPVTARRGIVGTFRAMSPEQATGKDVDYRSDLFSFGVLLYELFTTESPFRASTAQATLRRLIGEPHIPVSEFCGTIPPLLAELVDQLLAKEPFFRPRDFHGVALLLSEIGQSFSSTTELAIADDLSAIDPDDPARLANESTSTATTQLEGTTEDGEPADLSAGDLGKGGLEGGVDRAERPGSVEATSSATARLTSHRPPADILPFLLRGRDDILDQLIAEATRCVSNWTPVLSTVDGTVGMGKTHLLHALTVALRSDCGPRVNYLRAALSRKDDPYGLARLLFRLLFALPGVDARDFESRDEQSLAALDDAWLRLGARPSEAGRWATGWLLGAVPQDAPQLSSTIGTCQGLHRAASLALVLALTHAARKQPLFLLIDDVHKGDDIALDALELATGSDDLPVPLGVWVAAQPTLYSRRPLWGRRAPDGQRRSLLPLDRRDTCAVLRDAVAAPGRISASGWNWLCEFSAGIPIYVVELARAIRHHTARNHHSSPESERDVLDIDQLRSATVGALDERLGRQVVRAIPRHLGPLAEICALLGDRFTDSFAESELRGVLAVDAGTADSADEFDMPAGLAELCQIGVLEYELHGYRIGHSLLRGAIVALIPARRRQRIHASVATYLQRSPAASRQRLAYHATQCGANDLAASLYIEIARQCHEDHRHAEADDAYSSALSCLDESRAEWSRALAGRGRARYCLQKFGDAIDDLRRARAAAEKRGDDAEEVALLLCEARILDDCAQWKQSVRAVELALARVRRLDSGELVGALHLACGRIQLRRGQYSDAVEMLVSAVRSAAAVGDDEIHTAALLLLAPALVGVDRVDEAGRRFDEVIARCRRAGDERQLAAAHLSRRALWLRQHGIDRMIADLQAARTRAHQLGDVKLERAALLSLAESLYWCGRIDEALVLARRSRQLYLAFLGEYVMYEDHLLLARILCSQGDLEAIAHLRWVEERFSADDIPPSSRAMLTLVRLATAALDDRADDRLAPVSIERAIQRATERAIERVVARSDNPDEADEVVHPAHRANRVRRAVARPINRLDRADRAVVRPGERALVRSVARSDERPDQQPMEHEAWIALEHSLAGSSVRELRAEVAVLAAEVFCHVERFEEARAWYEHARNSAANSPLWNARLTALGQRLG